MLQTKCRQTYLLKRNILGFQTDKFAKPCNPVLISKAACFKRLGIRGTQLSLMSLPFNWGPQKTFNAISNEGQPSVLYYSTS